MSPLAAHPVGIKFWTTIWKDNKDFSTAEVHQRFQRWYQYALHRRYARYFYAHRAGPLGPFAPIVVGAVGLKLFLMYYGTMRDRNAATQAAAAYGQGGYKTNPTPK